MEVGPRSPNVFTFSNAVWSIGAGQSAGYADTSQFT